MLYSNESEETCCFSTNQDQNQRVLRVFSRTWHRTHFWLVYCRFSFAVIGQSDLFLFYVYRDCDFSVALCKCTTCIFSIHGRTRQIMARNNWKLWRTRNIKAGNNWKLWRTRLIIWRKKIPGNYDECGILKWETTTKATTDATHHSGKTMCFSNTIQGKSCRFIPQN